MPNSFFPFALIHPVLTEVLTEAPTEALTEAFTEALTEAITEALTEAPTEALTEVLTEAVTELLTEALTEAPTEALTEVLTEVITEVLTEAPTEALTEHLTEAITEALTEALTEAVLYGFSVTDNSGAITFNPMRNMDPLLWNPSSEYSVATGIWTAAKSGHFWIGGGAAPQGSAPSNGHWIIDIRQNGTTYEKLYADQRATSSAWGTNNLTSGICAVTVSDQWTINATDDTPEQGAFSAFEITSGVAALGTRTGEAGSANGTIAGLTEVFDLGGNYDPTTGVFTAPEAGVYVASSLGWHLSETGVTGGLYLQVDGSDYDAAAAMRCTPVSTVWRYFNYGHSHLVYLTASQTLQYKQVGDLISKYQQSFAKVDTTNAFRAYGGTAASLNETITGFTENFDLGSDFDASTGVFTAPADGVYFAVGNAFMRNSARGYLTLIKNAGMTDEDVVTNGSEDQNIGGRNASFALVVPLLAGDTLTLQRRVSTGGTMYEYDNVSFGVARIH